MRSLWTSNPTPNGKRLPIHEERREKPPGSSTELPERWCCRGAPAQLTSSRRKLYWPLQDCSWVLLLTPSQWAWRARKDLTDNLDATNRSQQPVMCSLRCSWPASATGSAFRDRAELRCEFHVAVKPASVHVGDYTDTRNVDFFRDSTEAGSNLLKLRVTDGFFWRSGIPMATVIWTLIGPPTSALISPYFCLRSSKLRRM